MRRSHLTIILAATGLGAFSGTASAVTQPQVSYRLTEITPPGARSDPLPADVDNRGQVAGATLNHPGDAASFLRTRGGEFINLELLPGANAAAVNAIGQNGKVVGLSGPDLFSARAVMWDRRGNVTEIGALPGDTFSLANDADFWGRVIGASGTVNGVATTAFIWARGHLRQVPIPGFPFASLEAFGFGSMAGNAWTTELDVDGQGFIINRRGEVTMIGLLPGGTVSQLFDMNLFGTAVGLADDGSGPPKALIYKRGRLESLAALPGDDFAKLIAINNWGTAVGQSFGPMGPRAAISRFSGPLVDLNTMLDPDTGAGWLVFGASGINDRGQIAGAAVDLTQAPPVATTVLLTPVWK